MSDTVSLTIFEKLNGENYAIWKIRMKAVLVSKGLWKVTDSAHSDAELSESDQGKPEQALALIVHAVAADQMIHLKACSTSQEAWMKLSEIYAEPSAANRIRLYEKFVDTSFYSRWECKGSCTKVCKHSYRALLCWCHGR